MCIWRCGHKRRVGVEGRREGGEREHKGLEMRNRKPGPVEEEGFL